MTVKLEIVVSSIEPIKPSYLAFYSSKVCQAVAWHTIIIDFKLTPPGNPGH